MREKQESIIILRAGCVAGLAMSVGIAASAAFLDLVTPLYDAEAPRLLPDAYSLALKSLPVSIGLFATMGTAAHLLLKRNNWTREIHYVLASMASLYTLFIAAAFVAPAGDGTMLALALGLPISLVLSFPLGMNLRRQVVLVRPWHRHHSRAPTSMSFYARFNH